MTSEFGVPKGFVDVVTVRKDIAQKLVSALNSNFGSVWFQMETEPDAFGATVYIAGPVPSARMRLYKEFVHGYVSATADVMKVQCTDLAPGMGGDILLALAFNFHREHFGVFQGNNFVECPKCLFHVHVSNDGNELIRHWGNVHDPKPIRSVDDDRLK